MDPSHGETVSYKMNQVSLIFIQDDLTVRRVSLNSPIIKTFNIVGFYMDSSHRKTVSYILVLVTILEYPVTKRCIN